VMHERKELVQRLVEKKYLLTPTMADRVLR